MTTRDCDIINLDCDVIGLDCDIIDLGCDVTGLGFGNFKRFPGGSNVQTS